MRRHLKYFIVPAFVIFPLTVQAQENLPTKSVIEKSPSVPLVPLSSHSKISVPFATGIGLSTPIMCNSDGYIFLRGAIGAGFASEPIGISKDGQFVTRYGRDKMNDISNPLLISFFPTDAAVYVLTLGQENPRDRSTKVQKPDGTTETRQVRQYSVKKFYIARFGLDGNYIGAIRLDLPFEPMQIGVFPNGSFLIAGAQQGSNEPRVALVDWRGELQQFVQLKQDIDSEFPDFKGDKRPAIGKSLHDAVRLSEIVPDGVRLLLIRTGIQSPIFSISEGGEVQSTQLRVAQKYDLFELKSARDSWVVEYTTTDSANQGVRFVTYSFEKDTGNPVEEYVFPNAIGFGLACTDGEDFKFLTENTANTLDIEQLRRTPVRQSPLSRLPQSNVIRDSGNASAQTAKPQ